MGFAGGPLQFVEGLAADLHLVLDRIAAAPVAGRAGRGLADDVEIAIKAIAIAIHADKGEVEVLHLLVEAQRAPAGWVEGDDV